MQSRNTFILSIFLTQCDELNNRAKLNYVTNQIEINSWTYEQFKWKFYIVNSIYDELITEIFF